LLVRATSLAIRDPRLFEPTCLDLASLPLVR
jgi:hypothetical protein